MRSLMLRGADEVEEDDESTGAPVPGLAAARLQRPPQNPQN